MTGTIVEGSIVVIAAFEEVPEHRFKVTEVFEDCVGGFALEGPLAGAYGEPSFDMIKGPALGD